MRNHLAEHASMVLLVSGIAALFVWNDLLWRWDNLIYDTQLSLWSRPVANDIVIITIDEQSLLDLGRWPWPRATHAKLLDILRGESPRAVGLDIIFSEADSQNPASDEALATAIAASGNIVLPVYMAQSAAHALPIEALPLPAYSRHAGALGHVNIDISRDGIARRIYLREGIGEPHWPHFALALLELSGEALAIRQRIQAAMPAPDEQASPMQWSKAVPWLIPYAGPPEHFTRIGYSQVLDGIYPKDFFADKIVLIGTTAEGMGDAFPTPLSGHSRPMSGVEIVANVIDALRHDLYLQPLGLTSQMLLTLLLIAGPLLIYPFLKPAFTLLILFGFVT
ncbi:MAG: CHASE2 domain-containing protein, partial [Mariprofundaceae bacterium]|nr:CHASE2 domain-containing protein [Mariprofundaceae bacterium]